MKLANVLTITYQGNPTNYFGPVYCQGEVLFRTLIRKCPYPFFYPTGLGQTAYRPHPYPGNKLTGGRAPKYLDR